MKGVLLSLAWLLAACCIQAQDDRTGPVINGFGPHWKISDPTYSTDRSKTFKAVFDVMNSPENHEQINPWIETAARFLNMHASAGVPVNQLHVALVVHNKASKDLLDDTHYMERFGVSNPNTALLRSLMDKGARIIFCGQSSHAREIPIEETVNGVQLSLSAMTALIQLQDEGYRLIKF